MRKLIDIPKQDLIPLKILAVKSGKDLKNYIQDILSNHVRGDSHVWVRWLFFSNGLYKVSAINNNLK